MLALEEHHIGDSIMANIINIMMYILAVALIYAIIKDIKIYHKKHFRGTLHYLVTSIYCILIIFIFANILYNSIEIYNLSIIRRNGTKLLIEICNKQKIYNSKYGHYAKTFNELGLDEGTCSRFNSRYAYFMNKDTLCKYYPPTKPTYINDGDKIYAVSEIYIKGNGYLRLQELPGKYDILMIDYNGNLELAQGMPFWPLPEPKWHEWQ
jgi:hypothetical protein